jgi:phosphoribosylformylglycinamidine synthase
MAGKSRLMLLSPSGRRQRMGGSALARVYRQLGDTAPDVDSPAIFAWSLAAVQKMLRQNLILAGHDRSDGGLITCLLEMAFAGNCGLRIRNQAASYGDLLKFLFNEELGMIIEYLPENEGKILEILRWHGLDDEHFLLVADTREEPQISIEGGGFSWSADMRKLRKVWMETSYQMERLQMDPGCAREWYDGMTKRTGMKFHHTFPLLPSVHIKKRPKVAVLREEGTNGEREMAGAFYLAGFDPWDVAMTDLARGFSLSGFRGLVLCGGFSFADAPDSGKGWYAVIMENARISNQIRRFFERPDTFSLGVCNGCQVMALLGLPWSGADNTRQPRFVRNKSGIFEHRYVSVSILPSPAIMLRGMEYAVLGAIVAHEEGRCIWPQKALMEKALGGGLAPIRFVDDDAGITEEYPFNPNGSEKGITALCSPDGRQLAMMPHPERLFKDWQHPVMHGKLGREGYGPWFRMFQNARQWCEGS